MNKLQLFLLSIVLISWSTTATWAQKMERDNSDSDNGRGVFNSNTGFEPRRLQLGGDIGLSFGNQSGFVMVSPLVGYQVTSRFSGGLGPMFEHYWYRPSVNDKVSATVVGGRIYSRYQIFNFLFAHGEFALINYKVKVNNLSDNIWLKRLPLGLGYSQRLGGGNTYSYLMFLYDVLYDPNSPYQMGNVYNGLIFRAGITVGL